MKETAEFQSFLRRFPFDPARRGFIGIERERFLVNASGMPVPRSPEFLERIGKTGAWTYELSACQVEHRTRPHADQAGLFRDMMMADGRATTTASRMGCVLANHGEVGPENMPLTVYPGEPRYAEIEKRLSREQLSAACRVAGTHVHYGVGSWDEAFRVYHTLRENIDALSAAGDSSKGERLRLYRVVAPNCDPPKYKSFEHFFKTACALGFAENPRNCWHLIRITGHGTVECRVFGVPRSPRAVLGWAEMIKRLAES